VQNRLHEILEDLSLGKAFAQAESIWFNWVHVIAGLREIVGVVLQ